MTKAKKQASVLPLEFRNDKAEEVERKYRVQGAGWDQRVAILREIFDFVAAEQKHFVTLDHATHTEGYDERLVAAARVPMHTKPLRTRYYWATMDLDGYKPGDEGKAEIRTEKKIGKPYYEQVVKLGGSGSKTLKRGEHKSDVDAPGVNLAVYPAVIRRAADGVTQGKRFYPLIRIQSQSEPVLYHPQGKADTLFEIKFDVGVGKAFDGFEEDIIEVEIEVKEAPKAMSEKDVEKLLDQSERILMRRFADRLEPIFEAKAAALFRHLVGWRERDEKDFERAAKATPFNPK